MGSLVTQVTKFPLEDRWPQRVSDYPRNLIDCSLKVLNFFSSRSSIISTVVTHTPLD